MFWLHFYDHLAWHFPPIHPFKISWLMGEFDLRSRQMSWRPYVMMWVHIYLNLSSFHCQSAIRANLQILYLFVELLKVYQLLHSHVLFLLMHLTLALACTDRYMHLFCLVDFYDLISRIDNNNVRSRADKTNALYYAETLISRHRKIKKMETSYS